MADDIRSWIVKALVSHDQEHGADLGKARRGSYCQLIKFTTYRDDQWPKKQIHGRITDRTHWVDVYFDVKATDDFEQPRHGLEAESLTSHLRSVFLIRSYRIHLHDRPNHQDGSRSLSRTSSHLSRAGSEIPVRAEPDIPRAKLEILDWEVVSGNRHDPVFFERVEEVGMGKGDAEAQRVLRKWWAGESYEHPSHRDTDHAPKAGPSRLSDVSSKPATVESKFIPKLSRDHLLEHILKHPNTDRIKALPDWLFEVSADQREELDGITMFGLDPEAEADAAEVKMGVPPVEAVRLPPAEAAAMTEARPTSEHLGSSEGESTGSSTRPISPPETTFPPRRANPPTSPSSPDRRAISHAGTAATGMAGEEQPETVDVFIPPRATPASQDPSIPQSTIALPQLAQHSPPSRPSERNYSTQARSPADVRLFADNSEQEVEEEEEAKVGPGVNGDEDMESSDGSQEMSFKPTQAPLRKGRKSFEALFESHPAAGIAQEPEVNAHGSARRSFSVDTTAMIGGVQEEEMEEVEPQVEDRGKRSSVPVRENARELAAASPRSSRRRKRSVRSNDEYELQDSDVPDSDLSDDELERRIQRARAVLERRRSKSKRISGSADQLAKGRTSSGSPVRANAQQGYNSPRTTTPGPPSAKRVRHADIASQTQTQSHNISSVEEAQRPIPGQHIRSSPWPNNRTTSERLRTPSESLSESQKSGGLSLSRYTRPTQADMKLDDMEGDMTLSGEAGQEGLEAKAEVKVILVDDSEESLQKTGSAERSGNTRLASAVVVPAAASLARSSVRATREAPQAAPVSSPSTPALAASAQAVESDSRSTRRTNSDIDSRSFTHASSLRPRAEANDQDPMEPSAAVATGKRSALSYLNPLNLLRGRGQASPLDLKNRGQGRAQGSREPSEEVEVKQEITAEKEKKIDRQPARDSQHQSISRGAQRNSETNPPRGITPKADSSPTRIAIKRSTTPVSRYRPSVLVSDLSIERKPPMSSRQRDVDGSIKQERQHYNVDVAPAAYGIKLEQEGTEEVNVVMKPKLRGFRPDLSISDGLTKDWVAVKHSEAQAMRVSRGRA